jgi:hypothetical protein
MQLRASFCFLTALALLGAASAQRSAHPRTWMNALATSERALEPCA